jgi:hypothetical protein
MVLKLFPSNWSFPGWYEERACCDDVTSPAAPIGDRLWEIPSRMSVGAVGSGLHS